MYLLVSHKFLNFLFEFGIVNDFDNGFFLCRYKRADNSLSLFVFTIIRVYVENLKIRLNSLSMA
jgi:hypothetical protein